MNDSKDPSVRPSVCLSVTPFRYVPPVLSSISEAITIDRRDVHAKGEGQKSKIDVTEVKTNFTPIWALPDRNSSFNS